MLKKLLFVLIISLIIAPVGACSVTISQNPGSVSNKITDEINAVAQEIDDALETAEEIITTNIIITEQPEPDTENVISLPKYEIYDNPNLGFKIQYPGEWVYIDANITAEEFNDMLLGTFGQEAADFFNSMGGDPSTITLMWYDFVNASESFVPNANLGISDSEGITQNDFKSQYNIDDLQESFDNYYPYMFDNFQSGGMAGKLMGDNYFAAYKFSCTVENTPLSCYQAMTEKHGYLYMFTFTTHGGKLDEATYEKMLSTLEFY